MTAADDLKDKILDLADVYTEIMASNTEEPVDSPKHVPKIDGVVKSHTLNYPHRRYYLDLKKNAWGYFLRVTMLSTSARIKLAIPAEGMRELYNSIYGLLKTWWVPAPDKSKKEVDLPPSRAFRIDSRTLYFDSVANRHGVFLRISQVWATSRSAITIPGKSMGRFREIINELADHMSAATVEDKVNRPNSELQNAATDKTDFSKISEASALEATSLE
ncbi:Transcriptional activator protein Pur-alpha [Taenia solium]|eukprot:TsM_000546300 transcript=TsM_000546300 gene=TsM_000546300